MIRSTTKLFTQGSFIQSGGLATSIVGRTVRPRIMQQAYQRPFQGSRMLSSRVSRVHPTTVGNVQSRFSNNSRNVFYYFLLALSSYAVGKKLIDSDVLHAKEQKKVYSLENLVKKIDKQRCILSDHRGNEYDLGSNFHGFGKGLVKGMNIRFRKGESSTELDFKINHVFRKKLEDLLVQLESFTPEKQKEYLSAKGFTSLPAFTIRRDIDGKTEVAFRGVGSFTVGDNPKNHIDLNHVSLNLQNNPTIEEFSKFLSLFDLQDALVSSSEADMMRLKIGLMYRLYFPKDAYTLERSEDFFNLSISDLKNTIIERNPQMDEYLTDANLARLTPREILKGVVRYGLDGLADELGEHGVEDLFANIIHKNDYLETSVTYRETLNAVASLVTMGFLSSEARTEAGTVKRGYCPSDHDSVFLQLNPRDIKINPLKDSIYSYRSDIAVHVSKTALERITYQDLYNRLGYRDHSFIILNGSESPEAHESFYQQRLDIFSFTKELNEHWPKGHEVMVSKYVPPNEITFIEVRKKRIKEDLIQLFRDSRMIETDFEGNELINGMPIDKFIQIRDVDSAKLSDQVATIGLPSYEMFSNLLGFISSEFVPKPVNYDEPPSFKKYSTSIEKMSSGRSLFTQHTLFHNWASQNNLNLRDRDNLFYDSIRQVLEDINGVYSYFYQQYEIFDDPKLNQLMKLLEDQKAALEEVLANCRDDRLNQVV